MCYCCKNLGKNNDFFTTIRAMCIQDSNCEVIQQNANKSSLPSLCIFKGTEKFAIYCRYSLCG